MRSDVHSAALKAAAKVAFSVALLNGCASSDAGNDDGEDSATNESAIAKAPCTDEKPAPKTCAAVLASAYPTPGDYQWEPVPQSAEVVACCDEELTTHGASTQYRWDCCVAYDASAVKDGGTPPNAWTSGHGLACTPWGPPVPPAMRTKQLALVA